MCRGVPPSHGGLLFGRGVQEHLGEELHRHQRSRRRCARSSRRAGEALRQDTRDSGAVRDDEVTQAGGSVRGLYGGEFQSQVRAGLCRRHGLARAPRRSDEGRSSPPGRCRRHAVLGRSHPPGHGAAEAEVCRVAQQRELTRACGHVAGFSPRDTTTAATRSPVTLSVVRHMSRKRSTPRISPSPSSGTPTPARISAITDSEPPGTPAVPTPARMPTSITNSWSARLRSTPKNCARNSTVTPSNIAVPFWLAVAPMVSTKREIFGG